MADALIVDLATGETATRPETAAELAEKAANLVIQQQASADETTRRGAVAQQVQALVGVRFPDMNAAQRQTLIVALLYKLGAIDKTLAVRPLSEWL